MKKTTSKFKTISNTTKKEGGGFDSLQAAPRERNSTEGGSRTRGKTLGRPRPPRRIPLAIQQRMGGFDSTRTTPKERSSTEGRRT